MPAQIKQILLISCGLFLVQQNGSANDTAVGGEGSLPIPISQPNIEMFSETIKISGKNLNSPSMTGSWYYDCDFTFKNTSGKALDIAMAFPFPVNSGESDIALPAGQKFIVGKALVYDFIVTVNGKKVSASRRTIAPNQEKGLYYNDAYFWQAQFPAESTVNIHHEYFTGATHDVMGYNWVNYVLKTGALWQHNTIGHTVLEVTPNTPTRLCYEVDTDTDVIKPKPEGMQIIGDGADRNYVWDLKQFQPTEDMSLCLFTGVSYVRNKIIYKWLNTNDALNLLARLSSKERRLLRNTVFAQYGRSFDSADLQSYFKQQWWYVPNPDYSDLLLTEDDKKLLKLIKKAG